MKKVRILKSNNHMVKNNCKYGNVRKHIIRIEQLFVFLCIIKTNAEQTHTRVLASRISFESACNDDVKWIDERSARSQCHVHSQFFQLPLSAPSARDAVFVSKSDVSQRHEIRCRRIRGFAAVHYCGFWPLTSHALSSFKSECIFMQIFFAFQIDFCSDAWKTWIEKRITHKSARFYAHLPWTCMNFSTFNLDLKKTFPWWQTEFNVCEKRRF